MASERLEYTRIDSLHTRGSPAGFADSLSIWINKPHVVNRRLCGSKIISMETHSSSDFTEQVFKDDLRQVGYEFNDTSDFYHEKQIREEVDNENVMTNGSSEVTEFGDPSSERVQIKDDHESPNNSAVSERVGSSLIKVGIFATIWPLFLAHLSRRLIGELIGYPWSGVRPPTISNVFFLETT